MSEPQAGRELDALIAEQVMGWAVNRTADRHWHTVGPTGRERGILIGSKCCEEKWDGAFCPSTDIAAAWEVVEKLRAEWRFLFQETPGRQWRAVFSSHSTHDLAHMDDAETAPLAICRAALRAVARGEPSEEGT